MLEPQVADKDDQKTAAGLKLLKGNFKISIDDFATNTELIQVFKNENNCAVEVKYAFPLPDNAQLKGFDVFIDGKSYNAALEPKEIASDNYDDHIASGGTALMGEMSEKIHNAFDLSIGNFLPGSSAVVKLSWLAPHNFEKDQRTRQINFPALNASYSDSVTIQPITVKLSENIESITSSKHKIDAKIEGNTATIVVAQLDLHVFRSIDLSVTTVTSVPSYVVEENSDWQHYPFAFKTALSVPFTSEQGAAMKKEREFVFILDCSGSMSGDKIIQACRTLKLFLASLPSRSKFNIVRFGDKFFTLWPESKSLTADSVQEAMKYSDNSSANMCDTKVYEPLKAVLEAPSLKGNNGEIIPRVVFLLTDGQFTGQNLIFDLVDKHASQSSVYTIGIGSDVVEQDLIDIAHYGKGQALIVKSMNNSSLQSRVIDMLQSVMFGPPSVTLDFGVPVKVAVLGEKLGSVNEYSEKIELPFSPNRKYTLYGFMKSKPTRALQMTSDGKTTSLETPKLVEGAGLHTIACGALISHLRSSDQSAKAIESIVNLSLTFGVLSPYTAFVLTQIKNTGTPSYASMIMEGLDLTVNEPEKPVEEDQPVTVEEEQKPKISFTIEIPNYECNSGAQFNEDLYTKFNVPNHEDEYKDIPPSILDSRPDLREKIAKGEQLFETEQKQLGELFEEHIMNKRAIQRMIRLRRNEEEILLETNNKKEHADKIAELSGVMKKLANDVEALYKQFGAIISSYKLYDRSLALNFMDASLKSDLLMSKLTLTPKNEELIKITNFDPKEFNLLKMEVDQKFMAVRNLYKTERSPTHPDALKLADQYAQFCRHVLKDIPKAIMIGKEAFDGAIAELDTLSEDTYKDSTLTMQLLRDQLTEMTGDGTNEEEASQSYKGAAKKSTKNMANKMDMDRVLFMQHPEGYWSFDDVLKVLRIDRNKFEEFIGNEVPYVASNPTILSILLPQKPK
eukprot:TRINITY_DN2250_c0_g1_i2.p1 TRINITY_DN2250_c0_g1~~TRINITY_DN2250_c0_g1_i2.p1  ORF type:complete len:961 (+),score=220.14 TRINITY_DN2250_c0_g1_i2:48-2930(+)